jgi:hypothetical protein
VEPALEEDVGARVADALVRFAVTRQAGGRFDQAIAAHADQLAHACERDLVAEFGESFDPCVRVGIVAIDERAIDVEEHSTESRHGEG